MTPERRERLRHQLQMHREILESLYAAFKALAESGVQSYTIGSRSLTRLDLDKLSGEIDAEEKKVAALEAELCGNGGRPRKAVGVVFRDW